MLAVISSFHLGATASLFFHVCAAFHVWFVIFHGFSITQPLSFFKNSDDPPSKIDAARFLMQKKAKKYELENL